MFKLQVTAGTHVQAIGRNPITNRDVDGQYTRGEVFAHAEDLSKRLGWQQRVTLMPADTPVTPKPLPKGCVPLDQVATESDTSPQKGKR